MIKSLFYNCIIFVICLPLLALAFHAFSGQSDVFIFLRDHVLFDYIQNSIALCFYVSMGSIIIGVTSAWYVVRYQFFAKNIIEWMLLLPMAFPSYIVAYAYTDLLGTSTHISIRSLGGAAFVMTLCLYPYIYLFARTAFLKQLHNQNQIDAAISLGSNKRDLFFKIILPNARPYIMIGMALVMMEVLADYGTVSYFNIKVFSTGIYNAWAGYGDTIAAARLSLILLVAVFIILFVEKKNRSTMRFFSAESESHIKSLPSSLSRIKSCIIFALCTLPVLFGFIVPFGALISLSIDQLNIDDVLPLLKNTLTLAFIVSTISLVMAYGLVAIKRHCTSKLMAFLFHCSGFGYALPGVVLGLGLLIVSQWLSTKDLFIVSGTLPFLILGYLIRFWTIPIQSIEAGFDKISPNIDHATQLIRHNRLSEFWHIRLPLLWPACLSGFLIIFVDVMKELPLTLILRPFNYDTLAVKAYQLAADERLNEAALPSLIIVIAGLIPILILARLIKET